jgi:hypothetical protein
MIEVETPDGGVAEFPDGTPPEAIKRALQKMFPPQAAPQSVPQAVPQSQAMSPRQEFDELPWYGKAAQAADDTARFLANGMTLGYADKFAGYMGGEGTEAERAKTAEAKERAGAAGTAAEIVGTMIPAGALTNSALSATRYLPRVAPGLLGRSAAMGIDGAALGAVQATGYDQDPTTGAAVGFAGGFGGNLLGEGIGAGLNKLAGVFNKKPQTMTADQLKQTGAAAYRKAKDAGVIFKPEAVERLRQTVYNDLAEFGFHPTNQPGAGVAYNELERLAQGGNVSLEGLESLRRMASGGYNPTNPSNNELLRRIAERIDEFASSAGPDDILTGNVQAATDALAEGRDYWSRFRKLEKVQELIDRAGRQASSTGSGGNVENATRQQLRRILDNKKMMRGFTPDEIKAIEDAVFGTPAQNTLRLVGKLSPQGNGLMAALGIGGAASIPGVALPAMAIGAGAKKASEAMTRANAETVKNLVAAGGDKASLLGQPNALQQLIQKYSPLLGRAVMAGTLVGTAGK